MLEIAVLNANDCFQLPTRHSTIVLGSVAPDGPLDAFPVLIDDPRVAPLQCRIERDPTVAGRVTISNFGHSLVLSSGQRIHSGMQQRLDLPLNLRIGDTQVQLFDPADCCVLDDALIELPLARTDLSRPDTMPLDELSPQAATLTSWFDALGELQRSVAGTREFFDLAARAVFNPGGMDAALVLKKEGLSWGVVGHHTPFPEHGISFRRELVERAIDRQAILCHEAQKIESQQVVNGLHAAVVCPVIERDGAITTVLYGIRSQDRRNNRRGIRLLEAKFVGLIADSIMAAMMRLDREAESARFRVLLEQAFAPDVVSRLEHDPSILEGQDREVTVMFVDLRRFSALSERIGARQTYRMLSDVMDRFSQIVTEHHGVIIDYFGDGLAAFWNAPIDQPDHPLLACHTAHAILDSLDELNEVWALPLRENLQVGIGIHTGMAQVGNSGSRYRLKYGPQGATVNIAARLEKMTKSVGVPLLVSDATGRRLRAQFEPVRLGTVLLPGMQQPCDLVHPVRPNEHLPNAEAYRQYQSALTQFEQRRFDDALGILAELVTAHDWFGAAEALLKECRARLEPNRGASPLFQIPEGERETGRVRAATEQH